MTYFLGQMVVIVVLSVVVAMVRSRRARRRREDLHTGGEATCRARLGSGTDGLDAGRLRMSSRSAVWESRSGGARVDLAGARVLASAAAGGSTAQAAEDVVLRLAMADGTTARVQLYLDDAATLQRLLPDLDALVPAPSGATTPAPPRRRPWWAIGCLVLAALWVAGWALVVLDGHTVTTTVTGGDGEGTCDVRWTEDDGTVHADDVDCDDEPAGSPRTVWVLGWPAAGDAEDPAWTVGGVLVVGALVAAPGAVRLLQLGVRRRRRGRPAASVDGPPAAPLLADLPELAPGDLQPGAGEQPAELIARLAPYARRQVPDDGWQHAGRPAGARGPLRPLRVAVGLRGPAILLACVLCATSWWSYRWLVLETGATDTAVATSTGEEAVDGSGPLPSDVTVRFRAADGTPHRADVATGHDLAEGRQVQVEYSLDHPGEARLTGEGDALGRAAGLAGAGWVLTLLWSGWRVRGITRHVTAVARAQRGQPRTAFGLLTADGDGDPVVLVCDPLVAPVRLLAVPVDTPLPHGAADALAGGAQVPVHGRLAAGEFVTVDVAGATVFPAGAATAPTPDVVVHLLDSAHALARTGGDEPAG